jgi:hypothetical protein
MMSLLNNVYVYISFITLTLWVVSISYWMTFAVTFAACKAQNIFYELTDVFACRVHRSVL